MKVYVYTKIAENKNPQGTTTGDIIYIYPIDVPQAKLDVNDFLPVVMDLNIPCGDNFRKMVVDQANAIFCARCKYNDPEMCDVRKYTMGVWSAGTLEEPPKLLRKRRYSIDRAKFLSEASESLITVKDKTEEQKLTVFTNAQKNEQLKEIIVDKTSIETVK